MLKKLVAFVLLSSAAVSAQVDSRNPLFVVGGYSTATNNNVEVVDLSEENSSCPSPSDIPLLHYGSAGTFIDNDVMICGGWNGTTSSNRCFNYDNATDSWTETYSMLERRRYAAAVQMSPTQWWITGGTPDGTISLSSTEMFTVGEGFAPYVSLPAALRYHNLVQVKPTHFILLGDISFTSHVWLFDATTESWTELPDLLTATSSAQAGLATHPDGNAEVVVAAGWDTPDTQILSLDDLTWRYGTVFPSGLLYDGASVPYGDTFLVVGGNNGTSQDSVYKYDVEDGGWSLMSQHLEIARFYHATVLVPEDYVDCV